MEFDITRISKPRYGDKPLKYITVGDLQKFNNSYIEKGGKVFWDIK